MTHALTIVADAEQLAISAARRITALIEKAITDHGHAAVCLTGGRTPEHVYERLAAEPQIDWSRVHVFWGDERHVPPDHPDSNYGMAKQALLSRVTIPPEHVHRIRGELPDAKEAAREYEAELMRLEGDQAEPRFDLMLLGVGEDAHIASIFPESPLLAGREGPPHVRDLAGREGPPHSVDLHGGAPVDLHGGAPLYGAPDLVVAIFAEHLNAWRITLTPRALRSATATLVIVSGSAKADAVRAALRAPDDVTRYPAQLVRDADWLIDRAAARLLDAPPGQ